MKLIKEIESIRDKKGNLRKRGIFWCDDCNQEVRMQLSNGRRAKSCSKHVNIKHGDSHARLYKIWIGIKNRCLNPKANNYKDYGGRGITICPEWTNDYIVFRKWALNNGYVDNLTIDRINNDKGYYPENCQWILNSENAKKKRNIKLTQEIANEIRTLYATGKYTQKTLAIKYNVIKQHISNIINNRKWSFK